MLPINIVELWFPAFVFWVILRLFLTTRGDLFLFCAALISGLVLFGNEGMASPANSGLPIPPTVQAGSQVNASDIDILEYKNLCLYCYMGIVDSGISPTLENCVGGLHRYLDECEVACTGAGNSQAVADLSEIDNQCFKTLNLKIIPKEYFELDRP